MMRSITWILLSSLLATSAAQANDSFGAEFSHFAGHTALAGASTVVVDKFWPEVEEPAWVGFGISTSVAFAGELYDSSNGHGFSWLDAAVGTLGAAVGSYATDKLYIAPKVETQNGDKTYGMVVVYKF